mgnify:CR=1 FL=1
MEDQRKNRKKIKELVTYLRNKGINASISKPRAKVKKKVHNNKENNFFYSN